MQDKQFKKTFSETKLKSGEQEKKITLLQALLMLQYSQNYKHQKQLILNHTKQCRVMISNLNSVLKELPPTTTPALEECQKRIRLWEEELKSTNEKAALYHMSCQQVFSNLHIGIYTPFPEPIDLSTQGFQLCDILHYSYALVNSMIKDQQFYLQQYAAWYNNYGRYQRGYQPSEPIVATPYSYNRPQAPENRMTYAVRKSETNRNTDKKDYSKSGSNDSNSSYVGIKIDQEVIPEDEEEDTSSYQTGPSTHKVNSTYNVNCDTNRKLENNHIQKDQENIKTETLSANTSCCNNYLELKASKNVADFLVEIGETRKMPSTDKVEKMAQSFSATQTNVNSHTTRKLDDNDTDTQKDQEKIKADTLLDNTYSDNCVELLQASKNAAAVLLGAIEGVLIKTTNFLNLESKTDEVLGNTLEQSVAKPFAQTVAYSPNNTLEPKVDQATKPAVGPSSESKPDQIIDNASKLSTETADSFANNNWLVPAKTSADLKRLQAKTAETQFVREYTELKPADLSKQPQAHTNQQDNIKEQLPAAKSSNINPQPDPSTIRDYSPEYQSSQKAELSHFNQLVEKQPDNATTSNKILNRPKFNSLFTYVKNQIPEKKDDELLLAIKTVRKKKSKLSGMTRESIVAAVREELNRTNSELTTCVICIETFGDSPLSTLQCRHSFHVHCIRQWFVSNTVCPVCRVLAIGDLPPVEL